MLNGATHPGVGGAAVDAATVAIGVTIGVVVVDVEVVDTVNNFTLLL